MSPDIFIIGILIALIVVVPLVAQYAQRWPRESQARRDLRAKLPGDRVWRSK